MRIIPAKPIVLFALVLLTSQCEKLLKSEIKIQTGTILDQSFYTASIEGNILEFGKGISEYGHCWSTSSDPTYEVVTRTKFGERKTTGKFNSDLSGLTPGTTYYVRAYALSLKDEVVYGDNVEINTLSINLPVIETLPVDSITTNSVISGGNIVDDGGSPVTARGICWNTTENPTISDNFTSNGSGTGSFTSEITGLECASPYFVRAYAINSVGTSYGSQVSFNTSECIVYLPTVYTATITDISDTTATVGGNVTDDGGASVTETGIYWSASPNANVTGSKLIIGGGVGEFSTTLAGLSPGTTYYIVAYAVNSAGEALGNEDTFTTPESTPSLLETEAAVHDTLLMCYSRISRYIEHLYLCDAVYSNHIPAPDASWTEIYNHTQTQSSNNTKILTLWSEAYEIIYKVNLILASSDVITSEVDRQVVEAQAKAMRAYLYYNLLIWFGGVPLETGFTESMISRNSIEEVTDQIKADATEALIHLPEPWTGPDAFRIPNGFAYGMRARANLYDGDYADALADAALLPGRYELSLDYTNFVSTNVEIIWGFEKGNNTEFNYFFTKGSYVPVMRLTEFYLIEAEAHMRQGDQASALAYINNLRERRGEQALTLPITTDDVYQQWITELSKEGNMFITLKRFDKALNVVGGSSHKLLLPIPLPHLNSNANLVQNPGY